jgi:hypothetical protein
MNRIYGSISVLNLMMMMMIYLLSKLQLSFRSVQTRLVEIKDQVSSLLQFDTSLQQSLKPCQLKLVEALSEYLSNSQQKFDQSRCVEVSISPPQVYIFFLLLFPSHSVKLT